jgi:hypothetical protein
MHVRRVEIQMQHAAQSLHVNFVIALSIEALSHEVCPSALFQQTAFVHANAGRRGHEIVRVFDPPEAG